MRAAFEDRLAWRVRVGQHGRVDVNHDLVALTWGPGIEAVVQRRFGDEAERVGLLLLQGRLGK